MYQDIWLNGELIQKGERECASRYKVISNFCYDNFHEPFSVLDIGANMCYFGIRLSEDFDCEVVAYEFHQFEKRKAIVDKQIGGKITFVKRKLKLKNVSYLPKFEVILALSVLHHVQEPIGLWIQQLKERCKYLIIEHAEDDSGRPAIRTDYRLLPGYKIIGYGESHLKENFKRKILLYV